VSYLEIYNEVINDLLDISGTNLKIREDQTHSIGSYVEGLTVCKLKDFEHFTKILEKGEKNRQYAKTAANEQYLGAYSSRSHSIIRIVSGTDLIEFRWWSLSQMSQRCLKKKTKKSISLLQSSSQF